jgi:hypothetical protein
VKKARRFRHFGATVAQKARRPGLPHANGRAKSPAVPAFSGNGRAESGIARVFLLDRDTKSPTARAFLLERGA